MTTENIFNATDNVANPQGDVQTTPITAPITPTIPQELAEFVGAGKKYASVEDAYKAFPHAQQHISTLEAENARIRQELEQRKSAEDVLRDIQEGLANKSVVTPTAPTTNEQDISTIVRQELERKQYEDVAKQNQLNVVQEFTNKFGDKAQVQFENLAKELGVPVSSLNQLASTSPKAVFKLAGFEQMKTTTQSGTLQSDVNMSLATQKQADNSVRVALNGGAKDDAVAIAKAREIIMKQYS